MARALYFFELPWGPSSWLPPKIQRWVLLGWTRHPQTWNGFLRLVEHLVPVVGRSNFPTPGWPRCLEPRPQMRYRFPQGHSQGRDFWHNTFHWWSHGVNCCAELFLALSCEAETFSLPPPTGACSICVFRLQRRRYFVASRLIVYQQIIIKLRNFAY